MNLSITKSGISIEAADDLDYVLKQIPVEIAAKKTEQFPDTTPVKVTLTLTGSFSSSSNKKADSSDSEPVSKKIKADFSATTIQTTRTVIGKAVIEFNYVLGTCTSEGIIADIQVKLKGMRLQGFTHAEPAPAEA
jgi:hypothetical protein